MPNIDDLRQELRDQLSIRRMIIRQLAAGEKATRALVSVHAEACARAGELERKIASAEARAAKRKP